MKCIGIIPAAGMGSRLQPLPFSKELVPFGFRTIDGRRRVSPISLHIIDALKEADVHQLYFVINSQKTDIARYYSNGDPFNLLISYLYQPHPRGLVDALSQVTPWLSEKEEMLVFFGMPDTYFLPSSLFIEMRKTILNSDLDIVLGVFPVKSWWKLGMTFFTPYANGYGEVDDIIDKPATKPVTEFAWGVAVWKLPFQQYLTRCQAAYTGNGELVLSDVFMGAKASGMKIGCVMGNEYIDIGTIEEMSLALEQLHKPNP